MFHALVEGAVAQTLLLSPLQSVCDSSSELLLGEEKRGVGGCFNTSVCCHKGNLAYRGFVLWDLLLQNHSVHEEISSVLLVARTHRN